MTKGYSAPIWMTFRQALELQGHVRKGENASTGLENNADPDTRHPTLCHAGLVHISPVLSAVVSCRRDPRNTRESAVNGARKRSTGQPVSQAQGGMLEHGEHDRGAAR